MTCDQAHGLVTHGSKGGEEGDIDLVFLKPGEDRGRVLFSGTALAIFRRHPIETGAHATQHALGDGGVRGREGQNGLRVIGMGRIPVQNISVWKAPRDANGCA